MIISEILIDDKNLQLLMATLPSIANQTVRQQAHTTVGDVKANIIKYNAIDTGTMLGSVYEKMLGDYDAEVGVNAVSDDDFPYPIVVNFGGAHVAARPFFSEAVSKAQREFPELVARNIKGMVI